MKKLIGILFCFQLCVIVFYGVFFLRFEAHQRILPWDGIAVEVNFNGNVDHFHRFIEAIYNTELFVTHVRPQSEFTYIYTTDITLNSEVVLSEGRFPARGTSEFIHTTQTEAENQVGLIDDILPSYELKITHFSNPLNFHMDGTYWFHTTDVSTVQAFVDEVTPYAFDIHMFSFEREGHLLFDLLLSMSLPFQAVQGGWEFIGLFTFFLFSLLFLMLQYGALMVRKQIIFKFHGISNFKILWNITRSTIFPLLIASAVAYIISVIYVYLMRFHLFLPEITFYFVVIASVLILFYLISINIFVYIQLHTSNKVSVVKGQRFNEGLQALNHLLKAAFSIMLMLTIFILRENIIALNERLAARPVWEETSNVYRIVSGWNTSGLLPELELEAAQRLASMHDYLMAEHGGFIVQGSRMSAILDWGFQSYANPETAPPLELSPNGHRIDISPSFLEVNPIQAVNGMDIEEQLVWDTTIKNILVPQSLEPYEKEFYELYLEHFYWVKVVTYNTYALLLDEPLLETTIDELSLNIIYVNDDQCYFAFNAHLMQSTGGIVCNPSAVILHPDSVYNSYIFAVLQQSFYFRSDEDTQGAFESILPAIQRYNLEDNIRFITPVYNEFAWAEQAITEQMMRLTVLAVLILSSSLATTYYLMATYFETNKFELVVKRNFGYHALKRNQTFTITLLSYSIPIVILGGLFLGWPVFLIGIVVIAVDILVAFAFERRLMNKSFAEIMKGER